MNIPPLLPAAYTFNPSLKTIQFLSNAPAGLARIKLIFNNTRGVYYYNPLGGVIGGSYDIPTSTFTFTADTTGHLNTDTLFIVVDDGNQSSTETTLTGLIGSEGTNIPAAPSNETKIYRWFRWLGSQIPTSPFAVTGPLTLSQLSSAGLATAAKQPAFGAAGSPSGDVISVQGIAGGTPQNVSSLLVFATATFTRPNDNTQYASNDVIGPAVTAVLTFANCARVNGGSGVIIGARHFKSTTTTLNASFRLHLYRTTPTAIADNAIFTMAAANGASRLGVIEFVHTTGGTGSDSSEGVGTFSGAALLQFVCDASSTSIFGILTTLAGYIPTGAEQHRIELSIQQS